MTSSSEWDAHSGMPEWERELHASAEDDRDVLHPFISARFMKALMEASGADTPAVMERLVIAARDRATLKLGDDARYNDLRLRISAAFVLWRIDDSPVEQEALERYIKLKEPKRSRDLNWRTFRQALAARRYRRGINDDRDSSELLPKDDDLGKTAGFRADLRDALVALFCTLTEGGELRDYWDPTTSKLRWPSSGSEAAGSHPNVSASAVTDPLDADEIVVDLASIVNPDVDTGTPRQAETLQSPNTLNLGEDIGEAERDCHGHFEIGGEAATSRGEQIEQALATSITAEPVSGILIEQDEEKLAEAGTFSSPITSTIQPDGRLRETNRWRSPVSERHNGPPGSPAPFGRVADVSAERRRPSRKTIWITAGAMALVAVLAASFFASGGLSFVGRQDDASGVIGTPPEDASQNQISPASWGPMDRDIVSAKARNSSITLNSMIDNPVIADERRFFQIRLEGTDAHPYSDDLVVQPGRVYEGSVYFKNDAAADAENSVAKNTRLRLEIPYVVYGSANAYARLSSDNAVPSEVWDGVTVVLPQPDEQAALRYVAGSATLHSRGAADGSPLDDALFGPDGVQLGCDRLDGDLPSRDECAGYVTFKLRVDEPDFTVSAAARIKGSTDPFASQVTAAVGDVVEVGVSYQNTGTNQQDDVVIRVLDLPTGVRYVPESTQIANAVTGGEYKRTIDGITGPGYNAGSYQPKGNVFFKFDLILDESLLSTEGSRWITMSPFARVTTSAGHKEAPLTLTLIRSSRP